MALDRGGGTLVDGWVALVAVGLAVVARTCNTDRKGVVVDAGVDHAAGVGAVVDLGHRAKVVLVDGGTVAPGKAVQGAVGAVALDDLASVAAVKGEEGVTGSEIGEKVEEGDRVGGVVDEPQNTNLELSGLVEGQEPFAGRDDDAIEIVGLVELVVGDRDEVVLDPADPGERGLAKAKGCRSVLERAADLTKVDHEERAKVALDRDPLASLLVVDAGVAGGGAEDKKRNGAGATLGFGIFDHERKSVAASVLLGENDDEIANGRILVVAWLHDVQVSNETINSKFGTERHFKK